MTTPWLAAPRSLEGLAALPGILVVVSLTCAVVVRCDVGSAVVVPFEWDDVSGVAGL